MGIGKTGEDIGTYNPLSIPMLSAYLSKISYQIGEYDLAEKSARVVLQEYCQTSQYLSQDERANYHYYYVLNEEALSNVSLVEMRTIGETFYILGLCERRRVISSRDDKDKLNVAKQDK